MAKRLFDKHKKKFLKENGFCKFDLKAKAILPLLEQIYKKNLLNQSEQAFYVTHNDGNVEKITHIHNEIVKVCEPFITDVFPDFEVFAAHFVVKKAHSKVSFQLHQDWSSVEEYVENSVQIWIPLSLSYPENGGMGFIPKSHLFFNNYRSGSYGIPHVEVVPKLYPYLSYLRLFPGEAAFFYNSTFHCSFINSTDEDRVAVLLNIAPKNMKKIYFHQDGNHVEKYEMDTVQLYERLHLLEKGELPHGLRLLERAPYEQPDNTSIDADLLIRKLTEMNHKQGLLPDYEVKLYDIIKDVEIAQEINDKGYAIIDFLTEKEREEMGEWFSQYSLDISKSQDAFAIKQTKEIHQKIQEVIQYRIEHFFKDAYSPYSYLYSNESK